jgi:RHO1 GDP-GTP exchange protein 1/2
MPNTGTPGASPEVVNDPRSVYPLTLHHNGRTGGPYILYAESSQTRNEWKQKLDEALGLRKVVQESNKVFEVETLSADTFLLPSVMANSTSPTWNQENAYTGKVTCSVPFSKTAIGRFRFLFLTDFQILLTVAHWWQSAVPRVCGLVTDMIHNVRISFSWSRRF